MFVQAKRKRLKKYLIFLCLFLALTGCGGNIQKQNAEQFILLLTDCKTYETATTDSEFLEKYFKPYFTEDGYEKFLADKIHYIYPQLFYLEETEKTRVVRIQTTNVTKQKENQILQIEIKYALESGEEVEFLEDHFQVTMNKAGEIEEFLVLNTSDSMHKLVIDVKIY